MQSCRFIGHWFCLLDCPPAFLLSSSACFPRLLYLRFAILICHRILGRSRQAAELTGHAPAVLRPRCVAGRCVAAQRRGTRILHAVTAGRCQLPHSHLSHADQQQLVQLRLGVAADVTGWAPDMSCPHRARTAPHAQRSETTLLRAAHRSYGKVLGGSAGRQRQQRAHTAVVWRRKSCWAPSGV